MSFLNISKICLGTRSGSDKVPLDEYLRSPPLALIHLLPYLIGSPAQLDSNSIVTHTTQPSSFTMKLHFYIIFLLTLLSLALAVETKTESSSIEDHDYSLPSNMTDPDFNDRHDESDPTPTSQAQTNNIEPRMCIGVSQVSPNPPFHLNIHPLTQTTHSGAAVEPTTVSGSAKTGAASSGRVTSIDR